MENTEINNLWVVSDLVEAGGWPTTTLFSNVIHPDKEPDEVKFYMEEWADVNDRVDTYYIYPIDLLALRQFLLGQIPHRDLILGNADGFVTVYEFNRSSSINARRVENANIDPSYLPAVDHIVDIEEDSKRDTLALLDRIEKMRNA
jgi:hypothetical protein